MYALQEMLIREEGKDSLKYFTNIHGRHGEG
jgi:hypothetical protein